MRKIAIPVDESGILHGHFGHATLFAMLETDGTQITNTTTAVPPPHAPGAIPKWLLANQVTDVIAGGMGKKAILMLEKLKVDAHTGATVKEAKLLAQELLNGELITSGDQCNHHHEHGHDHDHHEHGEHHHEHKHEHGNCHK